MRSDLPTLPLPVSTVDRLRVSAGAARTTEDREALQARWAANERELNRAKRSGRARSRQIYRSLARVADWVR
jgi:hypothetical protein